MENINIPGQKIGILTYHRADNYGSVLQAYALLEEIKRITKGEVKIIDYTTDAQESIYSIYYRCNTIKNILKNIFIFTCLRKNRRKIKDSFSSFREKYLKVSNSTKITELTSLDEERYTTIVCGSDQIWNLRIKDFNKIYMLSPLNNVRKLSYAASMGGIDLQLRIDEKENIRNMLSSFVGISVRENIAANMLSDIMDKKINIHIDPVFLLDSDEWKKLASPRWINEEYIFFYSVDYNDVSVEIARWYGKKFNMPVYIMYTSKKSHFICKDGIKWVGKTGVDDFLSLFIHAKFVLTGSFHGTCFAVIFNKPFFRIQKTKNGCQVIDDRIQSLFRKLSITDREITVDNYKEKAAMIYEFDFKNVNCNILDERQKAREYLGGILL
ncbi:MAG TPA: polysaccharide pyruvyl transferase family protein [Peptococcaceae bacterium]|nr:polysaccharide pyruvyl transferase family protein [Peptococcaceae bacterium]